MHASSSCNSYYVLGFFYACQWFAANWGVGLFQPIVEKGRERPQSESPIASRLHVVGVQCLDICGIDLKRYPPQRNARQCIHYCCLH